MQKIVLFLSCIILLNSCISQIGKDNIKSKTSAYFPQRIGYVNDYSAVFNDLDKERLGAKLADYKIQTTNEIVIVTLDSEELTTDNFDRYTMDLGNYWGVGTKEMNNGMVILLSPELKRIRISTGLGTEKIVTDEICENILQTLIIPELKNGNYFEGMDKAIDAFIEEWK